jgi:hypothetical protein
MESAASPSGARCINTPPEIQDEHTPEKPPVNTMPSNPRCPASICRLGRSEIRPGLLLRLLRGHAEEGQSLHRPWLWRRFLLREKHRRPPLPDPVDV